MSSTCTASQRKSDSTGFHTLNGNKQFAAKKKRVYTHRNTYCDVYFGVAFNDRSAAIFRFDFKIEGCSSSRELASYAGGD